MTGSPYVLRTHADLFVARKHLGSELAEKLWRISHEESLTDEERERRCGEAVAGHVHRGPRLGCRCCP